MKCIDCGKDLDAEKVFITIREEGREAQFCWQCAMKPYIEELDRIMPGARFLDR